MDFSKNVFHLILIERIHIDPFLYLLVITNEYFYTIKITSVFVIGHIIL